MISTSNDMDYVKEFYKTVIQATTISPLAESKTGGRGRAVVIHDENGDIAEINISSSFINKFYHRGERLDICPLKMYVLHILKKYEVPKSEVMYYGNYLESQLIGSCASGVKVDDLPRDLRTGEKKSIQKRIDAIAALWPMRIKEHGMIINSTNVQVRHKAEWKSKLHPDIKVWVYVTADFISPFKAEGIDYSMSIVDIKGTSDLTSDFGMYSWKNPERMDHLQGVLYSRVFQIPYFLYLLFDWSKELRYKIIPVAVDPNHKDTVKANNARLRIREVEQTIENLIDDIVTWETTGYTMNPCSKHCTGCCHIYCSNNGRIFEI